MPRHLVFRTLSLLLLLGACSDDSPTLPAMSARPPDAPSLLAGVTRTWTGAVSTDWNNSGNWSPAALPATVDSVFIPVSAPRYPVLTANVSIAGVTVENGATLDVGAFDLTASGDVTAGITGGVIGVPGRLILTGIARTMQGRLPRMRITGSYSLTGIVAARSPVEVTTGRLQVTHWRIDAQSF